MKFQVVPKNSPSFFLSEEKLLEQLFMASMDKEKEAARKPNNRLIQRLAEQMLAAKTVMGARLIDLIAIAFNTGFYYARFLERNSVEIIEEGDDNGNQSNKNQ